MRGVGMLQDDNVNLYGQHIGVVVAETYEQARYAARLVKVNYQPTEPKIDFEKVIAGAVKMAKRKDSLRGDFESAFNAAEHKIDATYETPIEHHNPMEPHATIAVWEGDKLTLYSGTQVVSSVHGALAGRSASSPKMSASSRRTSVAVLARRAARGVTSFSPQWPQKWSIDPSSSL